MLVCMRGEGDEGGEGWGRNQGFAHGYRCESGEEESGEVKGGRVGRLVVQYCT